MPSKTDNATIGPERLLALFAAKDLDALIDIAFDVLRVAVVCDFASAFYRSAGNGLLKERDSRGRESEPAFMRRYVELTPALPIAVAKPWRHTPTRLLTPHASISSNVSATYLVDTRPSDAQEEASAHR